MVLASPTHWRRLAITIAVLMAAAFHAPLLMKPPAIQENRVLAPAPAWPERPQDFREFRQAADAYVADHFPARPHLIGFLNFVRMRAGVSGSDRVIIGRDGWLFYDDGSHMGAARNDPRMTEADTRAWLTTVAGRTEAARAQGAGYLIVSPPVKEAVYPDQAPAWFPGPAPDRPAASLPRLGRASGAGEVLYLGPQIAAATKAGQLTYSRNDTHWTGYGAYAGYVALMGRLKSMGVTQEDPRPLSSFPRIALHGIRLPRDLALMLGVSSFVTLDYPHFGNPGAEQKLRTTYLARRSGWTAPQVVETGETGKPVLLMTRDSFSNELLPFLYPHFSRIILTHIQDGFWRPDLIAQYRPNIVILEILEAGLPLSGRDGPPPSPEAASRIDVALGGRPQPAAAKSEVGVLNADTKLLAALDGAVAAPGCNLEVAVLQPGPDGQLTLKIDGWVTDLSSAGGVALGAVRLRGPAGDVAGPLRVDLPRPDVAKFFSVPAAGRSGFSAALQAGKLPKGAYKPTVYRQSVNGWLACAGPQTLRSP